MFYRGALGGARESPKTAQVGPKTAPRGLEDGSKRAPRGSQFGSPGRGRPAEASRGIQIGSISGLFWGRPAARLGLSEGPREGLRGPQNGPREAGEGFKLDARRITRLSPPG